MTHQDIYTFTKEFAGMGLEPIPERLRILINQVMQAERSKEEDYYVYKN